MSDARRVAVTGAASGIGAATATLLAARGWRVACLDCDIEGARRVGADSLLVLTKLSLSSAMAPMQSLQLLAW